MTGTRAAHIDPVARGAAPVDPVLQAAEGALAELDRPRAQQARIAHEPALRTWPSTVTGMSYIAREARQELLETVAEAAEDLSLIHI